MSDRLAVYRAILARALSWPDMERVGHHVTWPGDPHRHTVVLARILRAQAIHRLHDWERDLHSDAKIVTGRRLTRRLPQAPQPAPARSQDGLAAPLPFERRRQA